MTVEEAAHLLKVHSSTVYRLIRAGEMGSVRIGRAVRVSEEDVRSFIEGHRENGAHRETRMEKLR
jgi:excisionase family DNA binding protein